ncbi:MAG: N-acetylmuramoyl-L-alanine amidase [Moraxella osloensis]
MNCNDYSIGIELEGDDYSEFDDRQYQALSGVIAAIYQACPKRNHRPVTAISRAVANPTRGLHFDWVKLRNMVNRNMVNEMKSTIKCR